MKTVFAKYNRNRRPQFQIATKIIKDNAGTLYAVKEPLCAEAKQHVLSLLGNYELLKTNLGVELVSPSRKDAAVWFEMAKGVSFESILVSALRSGDENTFLKNLSLFDEYVDSFVTKRNVCFTPSADFTRIFGEWNIDDNQDILSVANVDLIFSNIFVEGTHFNLIDYEWVFDFEIPKDYIIWRSLYNFRNSHEFSFQNLKTDYFRNHLHFLNMEANFSDYVHGDYVSSDRLLKKCYYVDYNKTLGQDVFFSSLYYESESGFSENHKVSSQLVFSDNKFNVTFNFGIIQKIEKIRFDPIEGKFVLLKIDKIEISDSIQTVLLRVSDIRQNVKANGSMKKDGSILYHTFDPQFIFQYHGFVKSVVFSGELEFLDVESIIQKQNKDLNEIRQSRFLRRVWKFTKIKGISFLLRYTFDVIDAFLCGCYKFFRRLIKKAIAPKRYQYVNRYTSKNILKSVEGEIRRFNKKPLISIVVPVYNVEPKWIKKAIESIEGQLYSNWELCIADDCSTKKETVDYLKSITNPKIKILFLNKNMHISGSSNKAASLAKGDYIALLDHDDELTMDALYEVVKVINCENPDIIYSDEDLISPDDKNLYHHFKPDYSPDMLLSENYMCHLTVFRRSLFDKVGGFRVGFEGAQDHDLFLRLVEVADKVVHVPKVLYHWRAIPGSTAASYNSKNYAWDNEVKAIRDTLGRRMISGDVIKGKTNGTCVVRRNLSAHPKVSVVMLITSENNSITIKCIQQLLGITTYGDYEIILATANSKREESIGAIAEDYSSEHDIKIVCLKNAGAAVVLNAAASESKGDYLFFTTDTILEFSENWIQHLLEQAQREEIGVVGGKVYNERDRITDAGLIVGMSGLVSSVHFNCKKSYQGYANRLNIINNVSAVSATCLMVGREKFMSVNGFNQTDYCNSLYDVDLCLRLRKKGLLNVYTPLCEMKISSVSRTVNRINRKKEIQIFKMTYREIFRMGDPYYNRNLTTKYNDFRVK